MFFCFENVAYCNESRLKTQACCKIDLDRKKRRLSLCQGRPFKYVGKTRLRIFAFLVIFDFWHFRENCILL
jgi:hypothetical protein